MVGGVGWVVERLEVLGRGEVGGVGSLRSQRPDEGQAWEQGNGQEHGETRTLRVTAVGRGKEERTDKTGSQGT